jgi:hypothetical protein
VWNADKYGTAYRAIRNAWAPVVARGEARCSEPVCLMPTREIIPGSRWHLSHDPTGTRLLGPSHARCNTSEAATRGNTARGQRFLKL